VAGLAGRIGGDVLRWLPERDSPIVAARAVRCDASVIHACSCEGHRALVAILAGRIGNDMILRLAGCSDAVVAGRAAACDASMIHRGAGGR